MKKLISIVLCLCMILSMALCASAAGSKYVYVALGDEIAAGEDLPEGEKSYAQLVADAIGAELVNHAKDGMTAAALLEQVQSGEITEDLARANLITITCVVHDTIDLVFAKALESYNAEYDPDLTSAELMEILKNPSMTDPKFMNLVAIALDVFNGNPNEGIPPYLESEEFSYAMDNAMAMVDAVMAAIKAINPNAAIVITNQYNPYKNLGGMYALVVPKLDQGLQKLNEALAATDYTVVDLYSYFNTSTENLCNASLSPKNMDFTPNAAGHAVIAELLLAGLPELTPFVDVSPSQYYFEPVLWAVENDITQGVGAGKFGPERDCTRAQIVTFLWRAAGSPEPTSSENPFEDVTSDDWFYKAVLWAVEKNITKGMSATTFGPNLSCQRAQVVTFLWRANGSPAPETTENTFTDVAESDYFYAPVLWAVENGVTQGVGNGLFGPVRTCTRGQIVTFLFRAKTN
ncbi:MAG: S-layer homology domain-containing protein [Oscillospiraceae bacterium]|nr:S-layer homology domain-containing protein [Oscillospiraceae bacterium]